jgi:translation initiation factor IF-2
MAKMKVHELAKELGVKSSDILEILKNKGIEVKSHMSVLEDGQVEDIKKTMKAPARSDEAPKTENTETEAKAHAKTGEGAVKKKKSIIFVSNPGNSKMPGSAQIPRKPAHNDKKAVQQTANKAVEPAAKPEGAKAEAAKVQTLAANTSSEHVKPENAAGEAVKEVAKTSEIRTEASKQTPVRNNDANHDVNHENNGQRRERDNRNNNGNNKNFNGNRDKNNNNDKKKNFDGARKDRDGQGYNKAKGFDGARKDRDGQGYNKGFDGGARKDHDGQSYNKGFDGAKKDRDGQGYGGGKKRNEKFMPESPIKDAEKHRDEEKRRISQEKDKRNRKDLMYDEEEDNELKNGKGKNGSRPGNKAGKFIKPEKKPVEVVEEQIKTITIPETLTIKELADKMKIQPSAIVKKLFLQGQVVTVNQEIDYETAENIAIEYDIICEKEVKVDIIEELLKEEDEKVEDMVARPPVICVMGHVDHGKTSLLDAIRKTNVTDKEAGGITQHIGAYTVNINGQRITFLDTPGHEAFTAMRMRGANSTDIAILVVAADDGVMPQTVEAINHAKAAGIEIIVAVNKIDKPGANIERVKQELTEYGLIAEDWGGSTVFVPVSAKNGEGIENLLEMILLTADVLELKANPNRRARGLVIEAELDKGRGPVATILVQKGTLKVGDFVSAGAASGKVRAMIDDKGRRVKEAGPSTPVEILGLGDVPNAGEIFIAHDNDKEAKYYAETFVAQNKEKLLEETKAKMSLDDLFSQIQAGNLKELNLIIKADVQGSVEAVKQSLMKLSNEEVVVKCIHGGVGAINESDVILASASKAIIIGFNVRPDAQAKATAEREGVDVRLYKVIYQAIEDIEAAMKGMLDPIYEERVIGHAEVRQIFRASAVGNIAGSYVLDGVFQRGCKVRITREGEQIYEGELASLKRFKDDVKEVKAGFECGLVFEGFDSMQELDIVEAYIMVEVPR